MEIFAHRGIGFGLTENSIEAFEKCLDNGFSIEVDVQKTSDNKLILLHNKFIKDYNGKNINIERSSFNEIKCHVYSFNSLLNIFSGKKNNLKMAIHIKDENQGDILKLVCNEIFNKKLTDRCFIFDVTKNGRDKIKKINPLINIGFSVGEKRHSKTIFLLEDLDKENYDIVWWDWWGYEKLYTKKNLERIKNSLKKVYVISPELHKEGNHPSARNLNRIENVWNDLISLNVDGICTDYPSRLFNFYNKHH